MVRPGLPRTAAHRRGVPCPPPTPHPEGRVRDPEVVQVLEHQPVPPSGPGHDAVEEEAEVVEEGDGGGGQRVCEIKGVVQHLYSVQTDLVQLMADGLDDAVAVLFDVYRLCREAVSVNGKSAGTLQTNPCTL